jgi:hypothetical protein
MLENYRATPEEIQRSLPGDELLNAGLAVNSAFTLGGTPAELWPRFVQLGKGRGGWPLPKSVERFTPDKWHGLDHIDPNLQDLKVGDTMCDWSGKDVQLRVVKIDPPNTLVYQAKFRKIDFTWAITLNPGANESETRIHSRTRLAPVRHKRIAAYVGGFFDRLVAAGLAKGLEHRIGRLSG